MQTAHPSSEDMRSGGGAAREWWATTAAVSRMHAGT
jgi:hypothetical protein